MIINHTTEFLCFRSKLQLKMYTFKHYSPLLDLIKRGSNKKDINKILGYIPLNIDELLLKRNYMHFVNTEESKKLSSTIKKIEKEMFLEVVKDLKVQINKQMENQRQSLLKKISQLINSTPRVNH